MIKISQEKVSVIGAGLAGCEAAWSLANKEIKVDLYEMKPKKYSPAHSYPGLAELICSNSLKASRLESAAGLLKEEMKLFDSIVIEAANKTRVAAGGALAVDREKFSDYITNKIKSHPNINIINQEVKKIPDGYVIIASGPLTSKALSDEISKKLNKNYLNFVDAVAPIVLSESIDMSKVFMAARYDRGEPDYINCPMDENQYKNFYNELVSAQTVVLKDFEKQKVYEGCMPVEVMAKRGYDTLRFGPLKPVGLIDPVTKKRPFAVVQLRCENIGQVLYNLVGFQTNLKFSEQKRVFSLIPGLERAEFIRYGVMHLNTFIDSPRVLDKYLRLRSDNKIFFAGQITGVEGYTESASCGIFTALNLFRVIKNKSLLELPETTMMGSLYNYISNPDIKDFQPMGANMGILPELNLDKNIYKNILKDKQKKYFEYSKRSIEDLKKFLKDFEN
ncbi:MAG: methylenetetrahydrofolate--tRNA-(uracil(54)-C(5))-methyltransferase (FADH(2)-oxidizing) TrmFO [Oscillospiraceae bacterium]|nr:methylenetetrahydrofolate--tRNA-(uracil(54)-C(5))-methyltransferase (FADH(2)-oxidizing) TrmFO [Oscillospiraceae bacterium]